MLKVVSVVGARPNFMKIAPILREMESKGGFAVTLVHTGQHYDDNMSGGFFRDLRIPAPDHNLGVGSGTHAEQTAEVMRRFEPVVTAARPDVVLVVGDVNSTLAAALVSVKLGAPVAHVEAGLRSFDRAMPEEINRIVTDVLSEYLFATDDTAAENLRREGIPEGKIHVVGDVMVDNLLMNLDRAKASDIRRRLGAPEVYGVLTLHRPANVDDPVSLREILEAVSDLRSDLRLVFPIHPRTKKRLEEFGLAGLPEAAGIIVSEPLGYLDFLGLLAGARVVLSDSGGIQEEAYVVGVPCVVLRDTTERRYALEEGCNVLVGHSRPRIVAEARRLLQEGVRSGAQPRSERGGAARKIVAILAAGR